MTKQATGTFEVKVSPISGYSEVVGRMSIDKTFARDLVGTSIGEMLAVRGGVDGSAAYVAMERVTGSLHGRNGTFALQHTGVMDRGAPSLTVTVVPDSGSGELAGLTGRMQIIVEGGKHSYVFDYAMQ